MASGFSAFIWLIQFVTPKGNIHKGRPQLRGRGKERIKIPLKFVDVWGPLWPMYDLNDSK